MNKLDFIARLNVLKLGRALKCFAAFLVRPRINDGLGNEVKEF